jgi:phospholipid/cholesterol/gamma-HCH transport system permease protein
VLGVCIRPRHWVRPLRRAFALQVLSVGVEPLWFVGAVAVFVGISVVVQLTFWVGKAGQSQLLGPLLVAVVARELGPVLINLVVIVRSGSAMTTELGVLKINGEVRALEAQGSDPFLHLVVPRVLGMAVSTFCLTIVFIFVAFASGYLFAAWMEIGSRDLLVFVDTVSRAVQPKDVLNILAKSILPALFASASCCIGGLGVGGSAADIPQATQRALTRSVAGLFVISAAVSLLTYL